MDAGIVHLDALELRPGEAKDVVIAVPGAPISLGGAEYQLDVSGHAATIHVAHAHTGWHIASAVSGVLTGPCWRCVEPARVELSAAASEFARFDRPSDEFDDDLDSEYLTGATLDAAAFVRDGLLDTLPATILCSPECAGLCPTCGRPRASGDCGCVEAPRDARWDALREVAERLGDEENSA